MNPLPILLLGGAALLMMGGKKKGGGGGGGISGLPKIPSIDPSKLGPTKSYSPKTGSSSGYPNISRDQMVEIQNKLVALGFSVGPKGPDGLYGPATEGAVLAFQKKYMTKAQGWDGKPGSTTQGVLDQKFNALSPAQKAATEDAIADDKEEQESETAPIIRITSNAYYDEFTDTSGLMSYGPRIICITTTGRSNLFQDPKKEALARHNGAVFHALLEAAAIGNAGKIRFGLVDISRYPMMTQPKLDKVNGRGFPEFFPQKIGITGGGTVTGFMMPMSGGQTGTTKSTPKMQELVAKVLGAGNA